MFPFTLDDCRNIDDLHRLARRRLPTPIYDHVCGGADDEVTVAANRRAFDRVSLVPRCCTGVALEQVDMSTQVLGQRIEWPLLSAPWGGQGLIHPCGEIGSARAVHDSGTLFCLSTFSTASLEDVAAAAPGRNVFQLHPCRSRDMMDGLIGRARAAGYEALILTVDNPTHGNRERDRLSGFGSPPHFTLKSWLSIASKPGWAIMAARARLGYGNFDAYLTEPGRGMSWIMDETLCPASWDLVAGVAARWGGPFGIKGILSARDAARAVEAGATAVIVSNQGGRHFDTAPAAFDRLQAVVDAVGDRAEVILDGGMRRGTDILKAIALGAKACMTARPLAFGMAAGGQRGVAKALEILKSEVRRDMAFMGAARLADVTRDDLHVRMP